MATDFFEQQDKARKQTGRLVVLFLIGVLSVVLAIYLAIQAIVQFVLYILDDGGWFPWIHLKMFGAVFAIVGAVIGVCWLYKYYELERGGGAAVATSLGGRLIPTDTQDPHERKVLNVVEEMAIAS